LASIGQKKSIEVIPFEIAAHTIGASDNLIHSFKNSIPFWCLSAKNRRICDVRRYQPDSAGTAMPI
jgi:hypothetical protein